MASGAGAFGFRHCAAGLAILKLFGLRFDGGKVSVQGFLEHVTLQRRQGFAFRAEADTPDMGELVGQGFDFEVFGLDLRVFEMQQLRIMYSLLKQRPDHTRHLAFGSGVEV
ncbi:hypothetical protein AADEFJLK_04266 [Methylovulum psychrotolerans]|uniref:Uncharacterized protein n=1 Tax=Methylovulum psychrotolerans TaxID=1704499 RepID=A0A2S5CGQ7_9GAMM|nr:hypothetical protein AADEFJLK_04266 [Methylovulum psychrotolerans]